MSYTYLLDVDGRRRDDLVLRDDGVFILTKAEDNADTRAYLQWLGAGNTPADAVPLPPEQVSRAQAKIALSRAGILEAVEQEVSAAGGEVAIWYADALHWRRDNPNVQALGAALGLTPKQIDDLFIEAASIDA